MQVLGAIRDPAAVPFLIEIAGQPDGNTQQREKAIVALIEVAPDDSRVRTLFEELQNDATLSFYYKGKMRRHLSQ